MKKIICLVAAIAMLASFGASAAVYQQGDVNTNASVDSTDMVSLRKMLIGEETVTETANVNADEDGVDIRDLVLLKKIVAGVQPEIVITKGTNEYAG